MSDGWMGRRKVLRREIMRGGTGINEKRRTLSERGKRKGDNERKGDERGKVVEGKERSMKEIEMEKEVVREGDMVKA